MKQMFDGVGSNKILQNFREEEIEHEWLSVMINFIDLQYWESCSIQCERIRLKPSEMKIFIWVALRLEIELLPYPSNCDPCNRLTAPLGIFAPIAVEHNTKRLEEDHKSRQEKPFLDLAEIRCLH